MRYTPAILHFFPGIPWREIGDLPVDLWEALCDQIDAWTDGGGD